MKRHFVQPHFRKVGRKSVYVRGHARGKGVGRPRPYEPVIKEPSKTSVRNTIHAIETVIEGLEDQADVMEEEYGTREPSASDAVGYRQMLKEVKAGYHDVARDLWHDMDTSPREEMFGSGIDVDAVERYLFGKKFTTKYG